jgi:hypothetical protein
MLVLLKMLFFLFGLCGFYTVNPGLIRPIIPDFRFIPEHCVPSRVHGVGLPAVHGFSGGRMIFTGCVRFITGDTFPPGISNRT